ncbi:homogentisate 1,2-dioxygenase [Cysteiniphilum sp. QT6929]|uniref:homogentisate 1,2-dioxygenase n=1 Tax=Cysteiniphilum sp. QT6929 TaxID=2975055 RepID=UPI0024B35E87|nr:homogentisate 1,2-dioxygenase [Cysteiniphilum sp. QT6929]WHN65708.1 homogentisate 1,2-dioxygenase [Cysteiniphilum sp. QT6929]
MNKMVDYQLGFHSYFASEALKGALPQDRNSPQVAPFGLYAEQVNNSAFTAPRAQNFKAWQYRIRPSVLHSPKFTLIKESLLRNHYHQDDVLTPPEQMRWSALSFPHEKTDLIQGLVTMMYNEAAAVHLYAINQSMENRYFYSADGDWLYVLQQGRLRFKTEYGVIEARPHEVVVIPRGVRYSVELLDEHARGYICESNASTFYLPERGPIGANGLAEERHFLAPVASFEDKTQKALLYSQYQGRLWQGEINHSPLDVVAWHGNLYPYKYDLDLFCPVNTVLKDHADPSIFTVLTAPSLNTGTANVDFVIFPPRWVVGEDTFRPPYYHRNIMSECMGLLTGVYDAKGEGFEPGGISVHNPMSAHGPDYDTFINASEMTLNPVRYQNTMAFMFESRLPWQLTEFALMSELRQPNYLNCWSSLKANFTKEVIE